MSELNARKIRSIAIDTLVAIANDGMASAHERTAAANSLMAHAVDAPDLDPPESIHIVADPDGHILVYAEGSAHLVGDTEKLAVAAMDRPEFLLRAICGGRRADIQVYPRVMLNRDPALDMTIAKWCFRAMFWPEPGEWTGDIPPHLRRSEEAADVGA